MIEKWKKIINSPRFTQITLASASAYLGLVAAHGFVLSELLFAVAGWLGLIAGIGSLDSAATKMGGNVTANIDNVEKVEVAPPEGTGHPPQV